jgi:hypothetical protein
MFALEKGRQTYGCRGHDVYDNKRHSNWNITKRRYIHGFRSRQTDRQRERGKFYLMTLSIAQLHSFSSRWMNEICVESTWALTLTGNPRYSKQNLSHCPSVHSRLTQQNSCHGDVCTVSHIHTKAHEVSHFVQRRTMTQTYTHCDFNHYSSAR